MEIIKLIQSFSHPLLDQVFQWITMMGEETFFILFSTSILWCINKEFGYKLGFAYLLNGSVNMALKDYFRIPRPIGEPGIRSLRIETAGGYSFPSGHTQGTTSLWTSLMLQLNRRWVYGLGILAMGLVGLSRMYLGLHTPMDVAGGIGLGVLCVLVSNKIFDYAQQNNKKWMNGIVLVPLLGGVLVFTNQMYFKVLGLAIAFFVGYLIEAKYIRYSVKAPLYQQGIKLVVGISGIIALKVILKFLLGQAPVAGFVRYFVIGIWATVIAPLVFRELFGERIKEDGNISR